MFESIQIYCISLFHFCLFLSCFASQWSCLALRHMSLMRWLALQAAAVTAVMVSNVATASRPTAWRRRSSNYSLTRANISEAEGKKGVPSGKLL